MKLTRDRAVSPPRNPRYQDYVIRDGRFIGEFESMYADHEDPWGQSREDLDSVARSIGVTICSRAKRIYGCKRLLEIGCGLGRYANRLAQLGFDVTGVDVSATAIAKARASFGAASFEVAGLEDRPVIERAAPEIIVMSHVTWYVLPELAEFLGFLRERLPKTMLYHMLATYPEGQQKYGCEYFTNGYQVRRFFGMRYLEWGEVASARGDHNVYFFGSWREDDIAQWVRP